MKKTADPAQCLAQGLQALQLSTALQAPLLSYLSELQRWNAAYNLTAVREPVPMVIRHLLDSLAILPHLDAGLLPPEGRLLDVGSGAGLPGIPLALARPDWRVAVLDSNGKKARFLRHAQRSLGLANLEVIEARVEDHPPGPVYDAVVSRAFGAVETFVAVSGHLLADHGLWLAMRGRLDDNPGAALPADRGVRAAIPLTVPVLAEARHLLVVSRLPAGSPHSP